jgi:hypothetical protein
VTRWGVFLLLLFFALGLSNTKTAKAMTLAVGATALVLTAVMGSYLR